MATDSMCLENLDEFVHDENKVVTCKWLSLTLKIHVNQAKQLLYTFFQQQRAKHKDVNATYFVAGLTKGDNGEMEHRCVVVAEEDLESTQGQFTKITSCHVYSIQRTILKDSDVLYITNYEGVKENPTECNKYSSIHCKRANIPRPKPAQVKTSPKKEQSNDKGSGQEAQNQNGRSSTEKTTTPAAVFGSNSSKGKKAEPKGSIASMFAQSTTTKTNSEEGSKKDNVKKEETKENKPAFKKGSVMDMFANAKPPVKKTIPEKEDIQEKPVAKETKDKSGKKEPSEKKASKGQNESKGKRKSRKGGDSDFEDQPEKKRRRRIKNDLFDSSSEDEIQMEAEESPIPSPVREPTPEPVSPVPVQKTSDKKMTDTTSLEEDSSANGSKRRRRRKLVPKTYLDEDGFMVTEKVWESESASEGEVKEDPKKKTASVPQKKTERPQPAKKSPQQKGSPAKGKQTSLMSFFKKK